VGRADLVVHGGSVYQRNQLVEADLVVVQGKIAAIVDRATALESLAIEADREIDATGLAVLPGAIDTHTHSREPGYTHKEDFETVSRAAAVGGVTTFVDMPNVEPPTDTLETFLAKQQMAEGRCLVDWGHWAAGTKVDEIPKLAEAGVTGYKIFQVSGAYPHDPRLAMNDEGDLIAAFRAVARTGLPCLVHPFNQALFDRLSEEAFAEGRPPNGVTFSEIYTTDAIWSTAVNTLLALQQLTGVRLHLLHTHSAESLRLIRQAKERGSKVTCEIDPKYYHFTLEHLERLGGRMVPGGFVTADEDRMAEIWSSLRDGTLDNIGTDHAPHTLDEVAVADVDAWNANLGSPQIEWVYPVVLTDVAAGHHSLPRAVELLCENPARLLGVWPRKGALLPGSDADFVLVDLAEPFIVTEDRVQSKVGWSPYVGWELQGAIKATYLRGVAVADGSDVVADTPFGCYIAGTPQHP
jgi:dihydroorotase